MRFPFIEQLLHEHSISLARIEFQLLSPLRLRLQNPQRILRPYVTEGMRALDVGCGMGFFTIPIARLVGSNGEVIGVDRQETMIRVLRDRARRAGTNAWTETRVCAPDALGLDDVRGELDFALLFAVVHEVPDPERLLSDVYDALNAEGMALFAEPIKRVHQEDFDRSVALALRVGFRIVVQHPDVPRAHAVLLAK